MFKRGSLALNLVLAFVAVGLAGTLSFAFMMRRAGMAEFGDFFEMRYRGDFARDLVDLHRRDGNWDDAAEFFQRHGRRAGNRPEPALLDADGRVVVPGAGFREGDEIEPEELRAAVPLIGKSGRVGWVLYPAGREPVLGPDEERLIMRMRNALLGWAAGGTVVAIALGVVLATRLTRPVRALTAAARAVAAGKYDSAVVVPGSGELGDLARSFNQMSASLATAQEQRRRLSADIAHDLRTPLSIILGHTEALADGLLPPSAATFSVLHEEAQRLDRLIEDLRTLSLAESGSMQLALSPVEPQVLLQRTVNAHLPQATQRGVDLQVGSVTELPTVKMDLDKISRVLDNLVDNALRHTPAGGRVLLGAEIHSSGVRFTVVDTGPGVAAVDLAHIFERFYRGDGARGRGGSGLGLAIARSLVELHGGTIGADSVPGAGTTIHFSLPL
ncbi:signal transduction histidine-protein kinase BaeS [Anaerolineaceae bacterium]|nr:signal transduction histidine-protein kinase BaeS [Anaerolineaceae bacterium]